MRRFIKFYQKDKPYFKMINQSEKGFELIILSNTKVKEMLELLHTCEERGDDISIVWQMKFKQDNFVMYKNCVFSAPMDNVNPFAKSEEDNGKRFKVTCEDTTYYTDVDQFKNRNVNRINKSMEKKYKDATLMLRMLKISELNFRCLEEE